MSVLSCDPGHDFFFVDVTWDKYRQFAAEYEINAEGAAAEI